MRGQMTAPPSAARHGGLFTRSEASAVGYSNYRIRRLLRSGLWIVVLGSVMTTLGTPLTPVTLAWAAVLATGVGGVASHGTAGRLWGLRVPDDPEVHVIVARDCRVRRAGLRTHRVPLPDDDIATLDGLQVTTLVRTIVDLLLWLPVEAGQAMLVDAQRRGLVRNSDVRHHLITGPQRHGMHRAWTVVNEAGNAYSVAEVRLRRVLRRAGLSGWRENIALYDADGLVGWADVIFDAARVIVELDGRAYHSGAEAFQADRTKQNRLVAMGYVVLRFTWDDVVKRPDYVVQTVQQALARAAA